MILFNGNFFLLYSIYLKKTKIEENYLFLHYPSPYRGCHAITMSYCALSDMILWD